MVSMIEKMLSAPLFAVRQHFLAKLANMVYLFLAILQFVFLFLVVLPIPHPYLYPYKNILPTFLLIPKIHSCSKT